MSASIVLQQMVMIFILIMAGCILYKKNLVDDRGAKTVSALVINATNPALMVRSVLLDEISITRGDVLYVCILSFLIYVALILCGFLIPKLLRIQRDSQKYYHIMLVYANTGFIGIPVIQAVLGDEVLIYVIVFNIFFNLFLYTHGILILVTEGAEENGKSRLQLRRFINIGTVSGVLALLLFWYRLRLPGIVESSLDYMGRCTTFLAMVVLGTALGKASLGGILKNKKMLLYGPVRMILLPIVFALVLKPFVPDTLMLSTLILLIAMPAGNAPLMLATQNNQDTTELSLGIIYTTVLSLITIPLVIFILQPIL